MSAGDMDIATLKKAFEQNRINKVKIGGFDIDGVLRGKYILLDKFWPAAETGLGFCDVIFGWDSNDVLYDNVRLTGWHTGYPDALARIDLDTFRVIPWEPGVAFFLVDFHTTGGDPMQVSPRQVLKNVVSRARSAGFEPTLSAEYEFFIFKEDSHSVRAKGYKNMLPLSPGMFGYSVLRTGAFADLANTVIDNMQAFGIPIEGFHTETGPGVYETAIRYDQALEAADKSALFKTAVKQLLARQGLMASFMAKWNKTLPGCGGHLHQSLWDLKMKKNLFSDSEGDERMSRVMRHYIAGQLELMPEMTALICPTINSYKRLVPNTWAPTTASWGVENRTTALRAIVGPSPKSCRVEYRLAGADINPYIAMASSLAAGLYGVQNELPLPEPCRQNAYTDSNAMARPLPRSLELATAQLKTSSRMRELLGDEFVDHFVATREWEVRQYLEAVTDWELERYFEII
jgi:glutamine synthetase